MTVKKNTINMTEGPIFKQIAMFAFPLLISNLLQLFYNAADLIVVSNYAGSLAMGAVGATNSLTAMLVTAVVNISVGANVVVARRFGANDKNGMDRAMHTALALALILGSIVTVSAECLSAPILRIMDTPADVLGGAVLYTRILYLGVPAQMVYNFCAAILRAMGDTKRPMYILGLSGIVNVVLNLIFVIVFRIDIAGVAIATVVSQYLSAVFALLFLAKGKQEFRINLRKIRVYKKELLEILHIGIPSAISGSLISFSNVMVTSSVNSFGSMAISGYAAANSIDSFVYMGMNSVSQATLTAVSQNYGAKNPKRMFKCMRRCMYFTVAVGLILGWIVVIFSKPLLGIYIKDSAEALEFAHIKNLYLCSVYFICGIMEVLSQTTRGLGYPTLTTINAVWTLVGTRIIWINFILPLNHCPELLFACWIVSWLISITAHAVTLVLVKKKAIAKMYAQ